MRKVTGKIVSTVMIPFLLVIFVLIVGCQGGGTPTPAETPTQEATIEATSVEPSPSPTETEEAMPVIEATYTRRSTKDPFMPVVGKKGAETAAVETPSATEAPPPTGDVGTPDTPEAPGKAPVAIITPKAKKAKIVDVPSDEVGVDVRGILKTGSGYRAILASDGGASYVVEPGQKVGEWTVSSIDSQNVVLTAKGFKAKLHLQTEELSPGEGSKKIKPATEGPKVPAAPKDEGGEDAPPPPE